MGVVGLSDMIPVSQQVWYVKECSLLKSIRVKNRSIIAKYQLIPVIDHLETVDKY
jgi:hypothetical protein